MQDNKIFRVCKNIIAVTLSISLLIYFGYAETRLAKTYADEALGGPEMQEQGVDASPVNENQDSSQQASEDEVTGGEENIGGEQDNQNDYIEDISEDMTGDISAGEEESTEVEDGTESSLEDTNKTRQEEQEENQEAGAEKTPSASTGEAAEATPEETTEATPEDVVEPYSLPEETPIVVASITYSYFAAPIVEEEGLEVQPVGELEEVEYVKTEEYYSLAEAFAGAKIIESFMDQLALEKAQKELENQIALLVEQGTYDEENPPQLMVPEAYIPSIQLLSDMEIIESVYNDQGASFQLDLNGHSLHIAENAYIDFGLGNVEITDVAYLQMLTLLEQGFLAGQVEEGSISAEGAFLFNGQGSLTIEIGNYWSGASIINEEGITFVNGGFFVFDIAEGFCKQGEVQYLEGQNLTWTKTTIGESEISGYAPLEADFMMQISSLQEDGNQNIVTVFYEDFATAWEQAAIWSCQNDGALAMLSIADATISGVNLSHTYSVVAGENDISPSIGLVGFPVKRSEGFDGNLFQVKAGRLLLEDCVIDGTMNENSLAQGSLIRVLGNGALTLKGNDASQGTWIKNNCSIENAVTKDPGAGIYMENSAKLYLLGMVHVLGNNHVIPGGGEIEEATFSYNVLLDDDARVIIDGPLLAESKAIGITYSEGAIAGLTKLGKISKEYLAQIKAELGENEEIDLKKILETFISDEYPSYFLVYDEENNQLFWDKELKYLPEAGVIRMEFILLLLGFCIFCLKCIPSISSKKTLSLLFSIGAICCIVSGTLVGLRHIQAEKANNRENLRILAEMQETQRMKDSLARKEASSMNVKKEEEVETEEEIKQVVEEAETESLLDVPADGREYYGILAIDELGIRLPVLAEYSDANMKTTPCVYYGEAFDYNLVIVGHNYDSQFAALNELSDNVKVTLWLMDGQCLEYESYSLETYNPDQVDEMLTGGWDLTVFTCNYAGDKRIALRCKLVGE